MTPQDVADMVQEFGQAITLRRPGTPNVDVTVKAVVRDRDGSPLDLVADMIQGDLSVITSNAEIAAASWPGPPLKNDRVVIDGKPYTIWKPGTRKVGEEIAGHWMIARGS